MNFESVIDGVCKAAILPNLRAEFIEQLHGLYSMHGIVPKAVKGDSEGAIVLFKEIEKGKHLMIKVKDTIEHGILGYDGGNATWGLLKPRDFHNLLLSKSNV